MPPAPKRTFLISRHHALLIQQALLVDIFCFSIIQIFLLLVPSFFFGFWRWLCFFCVGIFLVHFFLTQGKEWREGEIRDFLGKRDISSFSNIVEVHLGEEKKKCVGGGMEQRHVCHIICHGGSTCCSFFFRAKKGGGTFLGPREKQIKHLLFFFFFQLNLQINHV